MKFVEKKLTGISSVGFLHPSWKKRLEYASDYDFNETLIRKIADDTDCQNENLVKKISIYYEPIMLK